MTFFCCKINYKIKNIVVLYVLSYLLPQVVASIHLSINQVIVFLYCMLIVFIYLCYVYVHILWSISHVHVHFWSGQLSKIVNFQKKIIVLICILILLAVGCLFVLSFVPNPF